ncbi:unnamed protein product [Caenorhabditis angaria]|uniref:Uncharacterized protein n=1 Tax=Caenorhabditis angaria TaxID=860376 RepID=A0A9P1J4Y9_9PELO|nr:unnamed protein product [Caenorhabditis angaria]
MQKDIRDTEHLELPLTRKKRLKIDESEKPTVYYKYKVEIYHIYRVDFDYVKKPLSYEFGNGYDNHIFLDMTRNIIRTTFSERKIPMKDFIRFNDSDEYLYSQMNISDFNGRSFGMRQHRQIQPIDLCSVQNEPCSVEVNVKNLGVIEYDAAFQARLNDLILKNEEENRIFGF